MKELRDLQQNLKQAFKLRPEQTVLLLQNLPIKEDMRFTKAQRLAVYQNGYILRMMESLKDDFPQTFSYFKKEAHEKLVIDYTKKYPSKYTSLATVSERFPLFIKSKSKNKKFLHDLAQLEWFECLASYSLKEENFDFKQLKLKSPEDIFAFKMKLSGTLFMMKSSWTIHRSKIKRATAYLAIFKNNDGIQTEALTLEQFHILEMLQKGNSILSILRRKQKISRKIIFEVFEFLSKNQLIKNIHK